MNFQQLGPSSPWWLASFVGAGMEGILAALRRAPLRLLFLLAALLPLTACDDDGLVYTFEAVHGDAPPAFEVASLTGTWREHGHDLQIQQLGFNHYQLAGDDSEKFEFRLAGVGNVLLFDFFAEPNPEIASTPLHFPCKLAVQAPDMVLSCLSRAWIERQPELDVPRTRIKDDLVLTGSGPDLLALLHRASGEPEAFREVWRLHRARVDEIARYREAAAQGEAWAQEALAKAYASGDDINADSNLAVSWMTRAAEQGLPTAQQALGEGYRDAYGPLPRDYARSLAWFRRAAEQNHPPSLFSIGQAYEKGKGVLRDEIEAAEWYRRAAALGHAESWYRLGYLREHGEALPHSQTAARADYQRAVYADAALAEAWNALARVYADADDPALRNLNQALGSARRAVELDGGNAEYLTTLARVHYLRGSYDEAVTTMRSALKITPTEERQALLEQYQRHASPAGAQ